MQWIRSHRAATAGIGVVAIGLLAWVAFGYFGVHTLFVDDKVAEDIPTFAPVTPDDDTDEAAPDPGDSSDDAGSASTDSDDGGSPQTPGGGGPVTEFLGTFVSAAHPTEGQAIVLGNGTGQRFLRFEQFRTDNGPDLHVYLVNTSAGGVSDHVDLGELKGNIGEQNYEIPESVDLSVYDQVNIWCVRFSVGFGNATLAPSA